MAVDTRSKRDSAIAISSPWRSRLPAPDGDISAADRLHLAFLYSGIAASAPEVGSLLCARINIYPVFGGRVSAYPVFGATKVGAKRC